jgi:hypothetical protein
MANLGLQLWSNSDLHSSADVSTAGCDGGEPLLLSRYLRTVGPTLLRKGEAFKSCS